MNLRNGTVAGDMLDEATAIVDGYSSYYSYSRKRSGYSGVATYCKDHVTPGKAEEGLSGILSSGNTGKIGHYGNHSPFTDDEIVALDAEGRAILTQHKIRLKDGSEKDLCIINVYCPRFDPDREDRHLYKLRFYALLQTRAEALIENGSHVIILGDINTTHKSIDRCENEEESAGRTPSRLWMNQILWDKDKDESLRLDEKEQEDFTANTPYTKGSMFVDTYRYFYPNKEGAFSNWCTLTNARATNYGRRLDYIFADVKLSEANLSDAAILQDVQGSDHCPIKVDLACKCITAKMCPPLCTKLMPEFSGKQQKLSSFFTKLIKEENTDEGSQIGAQDKRFQENSGDFPTSKGGKRSLEKPDNFSQSNKKLKINCKTNPGKTSQCTLKGFFSKPKIDTKQNLEKDENEMGSNGRKMNLASQELKPDTKCESTDAGENMLSKYFKSAEHKEQEFQKGRLLKEKSKASANAWKSLLGGLGPAPCVRGMVNPVCYEWSKKRVQIRGNSFMFVIEGRG